MPSIMAKSKHHNNAHKSVKEFKKMSAAKTKETAEQLYNAALALVEQGQHEDALGKAQELWTLVRHDNPDEALPALNLLGEISVELGEIEDAKGYFEKAVALDPIGIIPETSGGGAEKFLWLAQLCEEGGKRSVHWFERGIKALQHEISVVENGGAAGLDQDTILLMRLEKKRKLANALCGIVEVYMTDLSWETDAEERCEHLITEAMTVEDETSPEVLQTLASIRLSQQRDDEARSALKRSLEIWQDLEPEDPAVPDFPTRISLARLLMEANMETEAYDVLLRLVQEDDQSVEAWYLGGWCQYLMAQEENKTSTANDAAGEGDNIDEKQVALKGSRKWLGMSIKLYEIFDYEDERLLAHAKEIMATLNEILGPENELDEEDEYYDSEEEWEGIAEGVDEDHEMRDA